MFNVLIYLAKTFYRRIKSTSRNSISKTEKNDVSQLQKLNLHKIYSHMLNNYFLTYIYNFSNELMRQKIPLLKKCANDNKKILLVNQGFHTF